MNNNELELEPSDMDIEMSNSSVLNLQLIKPEYFGDLTPYLLDDNVTDIDWNGKELWVTDLTKGRYRSKLELDQKFISQFTQRMSNVVGVQFNQNNPILEAETDRLRISIIHESKANTGRAIAIRKTPVIRRIDEDTIENTGYVSDKAIMDLIINSVLSNMNIVVCGKANTGKTEFMKYLTKFIRPWERAITIEDNMELHYSSINPGKDCIEMRVDKSFSYRQAIKASLRQNPEWILLSEARSDEVIDLLEAMSTGHGVITSVHTDTVSNVPNRFASMAGSDEYAKKAENDVYMYTDMGVLIARKIENGRIKRFIKEVCYYYKDSQGENKQYTVVSNGKLVGTDIPLVEKRKYNQENPFSEPEELNGSYDMFANNGADNLDTKDTGIEEMEGDSENEDEN